MLMVNHKCLVLFVVLLAVGLSGAALAQADYHKDLAEIVAVYPGANVLASNETEVEINAILMCQDDPKKVIEYYLENVQANGWKKTEKTAIGNTTAIKFAKDGKELLVAVTSMGGPCQISLALDLN
jgi:hypothetical protein